MNSSWQIDDYTTSNGKRPILEFIESLSPKDQRKIRYSLGLLAQFGISLREPHTKAIVGEKNLFELRVRVASNIQRIFYFLYNENTFVLLHGFTKKTEKTPLSEIAIAKQRKNAYITRQQEIE